jgi:hypothetical protein
LASIDGGSKDSSLGAKMFLNVGCYNGEEEKQKRIFLKGKTQGYIGELGSKIITRTIPQQRHQKCLLVFLNAYRNNL